MRHAPRFRCTLRPRQRLRQFKTLLGPARSSSHANVDETAQRIAASLQASLISSVMLSLLRSGGGLSCGPVPRGPCVCMQQQDLRWPRRATHVKEAFCWRACRAQLHSGCSASVHHIAMHRMRARDAFHGRQILTAVAKCHAAATLQALLPRVYKQICLR